MHLFTTTQRLVPTTRRGASTIDKILLKSSPPSTSPTLHRNGSNSSVGFHSEIIGMPAVRLSLPAHARRHLAFRALPTMSFATPSRTPCPRLLPGVALMLPKPAPWSQPVPSEAVVRRRPKVPRCRRSSRRRRCPRESAGDTVPPPPPATSASSNTWSGSGGIPGGGPASSSSSFDRHERLPCFSENLNAAQRNPFKSAGAHHTPCTVAASRSRREGTSSTRTQRSKRTFRVYPNTSPADVVVLANEDAVLAHCTPSRGFFPSTDPMARDVPLPRFGCVDA